MHIAIVGNIGAGKTTLTGLLAKNYGWEALYEAVDNNPYLEDFYSDMKRWSFNLQIYFLNSRFQQIVEIETNKRNVIQDRTIYEDAYIFAENLHEMGLMTSRDHDNYQAIFENITSFIKPPDLLVYLRASVPTLVNNIQRRGREYEASIRIDYLSKLNEKYEAWIKNYSSGKLLILDKDKLDFTNNPEDLGTIIQAIEREINGLFKWLKPYFIMQNMGKDFEHEKPENWVLGIFYFNTKDYRFILPKRNQMMGWTFNFAHPISYIVLILFLLIAVLIIIKR